jgi:hypothetical protein
METHEPWLPEARAQPVDCILDTMLPRCSHACQYALALEWVLPLVKQPWQAYPSPCQVYPGMLDCHQMAFWMGHAGQGDPLP